MNSRLGTYVGILLAGGMLVIACAREDDAAKGRLVESGYSDSSAARLSTMKLDSEEMRQIAEVKKAGLDEVATLEMVKSMHDRDLKFTIAPDVQAMLLQGFTATALKQLVDMGAIPRWTDDLRAMKDGGADEVTILEIARLKFKENKELLSGNEYARLSRRGLSNAGLLTFVRKGGTAQQAQKIVDEMAYGKSEGEALRVVGM